MSAPKIAWANRYAHGTPSKTEKTRSEIEATLKRFGATGFGFVSQGSRAMLMFEANGRRIRFDMPDPGDTLAPYFKFQKPTEAQIAAEERRLWRSLFMAIKAKLEVVESGITSFETEFLPYAILPNGMTFAEAAATPHFQEALASGNLPPMLPGGRA